MTVVYDKECEKQDQDVLEGLARLLSELLDCGALAALDHDDDLLLLSLFRSGRFVSRFSWGDPSGLEVEGPMATPSEFARALSDVAGRTDLEEKLQAGLCLANEKDRDGIGWPVLAAMVHYGVGLLLGNPSYLANLGYNLIESDETCSPEHFARAHRSGGGDDAPDGGGCNA
jgi:hypothetical protein